MYANILSLRIKCCTKLIIYNKSKLEDKKLLSSLHLRLSYTVYLYLIYCGTMPILSGGSSSGDDSILSEDVEQGNEDGGAAEAIQCSSMKNLLYKSDRKEITGSNDNTNDGDGYDDGDDLVVDRSHLHSLVRKQKAVHKFTKKLLKSTGKDPLSNSSSKRSAASSSTTITTSAASSDLIKPVVLTDDQKEEVHKKSKGVILLQEKMKEYSALVSSFPIEIRIENLSFAVPCTEASTKITTVYNSSFVYKVMSAFKNLTGGGSQTNDTKKVSYTKHVLDSISLSLKPGKMYLVLGPPGSGKSSLLKAVAGRLFRQGKEEVRGSVTYNGTELYDSKGFYDQPNVHIENAISLIDQLDRHAPRYTVEETFQFAFNCKHRNGKYIDFRVRKDMDTPEMRALAKKANDDNIFVDALIKILGIDHVRDSFVGNDEIRGVSGGQRRRVTVGEILMSMAPIVCGDEISNGLDAESTFDIISSLSYLGKIRQKVQIISLLQPSPETVALFDEVILLGEGKILYAGPVARVEDYFASLGYVAPRYDLSTAPILLHVRCMCVVFLALCLSAVFHDNH